MKIKIKNAAEPKPEPVIEFELRIVDGRLALYGNGLWLVQLVTSSGAFVPGIEGTLRAGLARLRNSAEAA